MWKRNPQQPDVSDEILAARVVQQDVEAFSMLYDRYSRIIFALAAHTLGTSEAEEIVQSVFMRLWKRAAQFDPTRGEFRSWFIAVARNQVLDALRERSKQQRLIVGAEIDRLLDTLPDPSIDIEGQSYERERWRDVLYALQALPKEQREALVLAYFAGLTQASVAEQLGVPLGTVKKRIQLGLRKMRIALDGHRPAPDSSLKEMKADEENDHEL